MAGQDLMTIVEDSALRRCYYRTLKGAGIAHHASTTCATPSAPLPSRSFRSQTSRAYMGHADIATTMIYVHHVP